MARPGVGGTQRPRVGSDGVTAGGPGGTATHAHGSAGVGTQTPGSGGGVLTSHGHGMMTPLGAGKGGNGVI